MTNTPKTFYRAALPTGVTTLFTCATGSTIIITNIVLVNKDAFSSQTATIAMAGLVLIPTITLAANSVTTFDIRQVLTAGFNMVGYSSTTNSVVAHISGVEQT